MDMVAERVPQSSVRGRALTSTAWVPEGDLGLAQWIDYGYRLGALGRGVAWWIGDWLRYGNERYGEKYVRAARVTGYDVQSLMNMNYVASCFPPSRRREQLSWSHHAEVAALDEAEQDRWLALAERERLSVHSLRLELRTARRNDRLDVGTTANQTLGPAKVGEKVEAAQGMVCPNCMHVIGQTPKDRADGSVTRGRAHGGESAIADARNYDDGRR